MSKLYLQICCGLKWNIPCSVGTRRNFFIIIMSRVTYKYNVRHYNLLSIFLINESFAFLQDFTKFSYQIILAMYLAIAKEAKTVENSI